MRQLACAVLLSAITYGALAAEPRQKDAVALAEKGARFIKEHGVDELKRLINGADAQFYQGALFLSMRDRRGVTLAHPNMTLIGKNLLEVPDADGKLFRHEIVELTNGVGKGWVDYTVKHPASGKLVGRAMYVLRVGDVALEANLDKR